MTMATKIPDRELPWSSDAREPDPCDDSQDWVYREDGNRTGDAPDMPLCAGKAPFLLQDTRSAAERRKRVVQSVREEALRRLEISARTTVEFQAVVN